MICPKCKKEIDDISLTCEYCGSKVKIVCSGCGHINNLGTENCEKCKLPFIKYCAVCHCANLPNFPACRKCGASLDENPVPSGEEVEGGFEPDESEFSEILESEAQEDAVTAENEEIMTLDEAQEILSGDIEPDFEKNVEADMPVQNAEIASQEEVQEEDYSAQSGTIFEYEDQNLAREKIIEAIKDSSKHIVSLSSYEGGGKSLILKYALNDLVKQKNTWLFGECSAATQVSPWGLWQDIFLNYLNLPGLCLDPQIYKRNIKKRIEMHFGKLSSEDYDNFFNLLYPSMNEKFENILVRKKVIFALLEKFLGILCSKNKVVIAIDDFDMIDGVSYEFLVNIVNKKLVGENLNIVLTYKENRILQGYFNSSALDESAYVNIFLKPLSNEKIDELVKSLLNGFEPLPKYIKGQIYTNSKGLSAYIEQTIIFLNEINAFYIENGEIKFKDEFRQFVLPTTVSDIIKSRLELVKTGFPLVYQTLCAASLLGNKFTKNLLQKIMQIDETSINNIIQYLVASTYLTPSADSYSFKNTLIWKCVFEEAKLDKNFVTINEKLFNVLGDYTLSNNTVKGLLAQNINQKMSAFSIWTENIKLAAALGDTSLYVISQKQSLRLVKEIDLKNTSLITNNICERIGKLIYKTNPEEAFEYLSEAFRYSLRLENTLKVIELAGYLIHSANKTGNFFAVIEFVDSAANLLSGEEFELEKALLKAKKLGALLNIGNCEEIVNLSDNEIIPLLEAALSKNIPTKNIFDYSIYEVWMDTNLILTNALALQGNNRCFEILNTISEVLKENEPQNNYYAGRRKLSLALANTIKGDLNASEEILQELARDSINYKFEMNIVSQWNLIHVLNRIFRRDWTNLKEELFSLATFANNCDDLLTKNLLKTLLAKLIKEDGNVIKAVDIYNEQILYFAKEKIAVGALLCWYFIAEAFLSTKGPNQSLDIAQKALDVAKSPKINNTYFIIYFKHLIAEILIIQGELQTAKVYLEEGLILARKYDLPYLQAKLYHLYGKYLEEMTTKHRDNKVHHAQSALKMYEKAIALTENFSLDYMTEELLKAQKALRTYCQLNKINL